MDYNDEATQEFEQIPDVDEETTEEVVEISSIAEEVEAGLWGEGIECALKLKAAGYNYAEVCKEIETRQAANS